MTTGLCVTCRTEEQAERLRRAGYSVTIVSSSPPPRPSAPRSPTGLDSQETIDYLLSDLRSTVEGKRLGRQFGHDSYRLAAHLGLGVQKAPLVQLQNPDRPLITILGRLARFPNWPPFVQLADSLGGRQALETLAHECGHFLGFPDERLCDQFASAFLTVDDDELPGAAWRKMQKELLERARCASRRSRGQRF